MSTEKLRTLLAQSSSEALRTEALEGERVGDMPTVAAILTRLQPARITEPPGGVKKN